MIDSRTIQKLIFNAKIDYTYVGRMSERLSSQHARLFCDKKLPSSRHARLKIEKGDQLKKSLTDQGSHSNLFNDD